MTPPIFGARDPAHTYRRRPAAYAVVVDDALRVACVREESGLFLPGGGIEAGEDAARAVQREVGEECGCALEIVAPLGSAIQFFRTARGEAFELHAEFFAVRFGPAIDRQPQLEVLWLPAMPTPALFHACHRWAVEQALHRTAR